MLSHYTRREVYVLLTLVRVAFKLFLLELLVFYRFLIGLYSVDNLAIYTRKVYTMSITS